MEADPLVDMEGEEGGSGKYACHHPVTAQGRRQLELLPIGDGSSKKSTLSHGAETRMS